MATTKSSRKWTGSAHFSTPKRTPNEQPWAAPHQYQCSSGHWVEADHELPRCPAAPLGEPCLGELRPVRTERVA